MNKQIRYFIIVLNLLVFSLVYSQEASIIDDSQKVSEVFLEDQPLPIKLSYSIKDIKKNTNDSTYINSNLSYKLKDGSWQNIDILLRARGNYRLKNCYFPPLKVKFKKSDTKDTPFDGNKSLKIVLPCLIQKDNNDNVIKEYLAYKLFEVISPYHFKTRLVDIEFEEEKGQKSKMHTLKGFLVEDDKTVAKRFDGKVYDRYSHPLNHEPEVSVKNGIFQYMIGNTDYSQAYLHNMKVLFIDKKMIPVPYDFDMAGFVNCSYAVVSEIQGESLGMTSVTQRKYRGFVRDENIFNQVRQEMLNLKTKMILILDDHEKYFEDPREFSVAKDYILSFFDIMVNDKKFKNEIVDQARKE